jgi:outer membrane protein TolC
MISATLGLGLCLGLAGCVPPSQELRRPVDRLVSDRLGPALGGKRSPGPGVALGPALASDAHQIDALLAQPLDLATATRIALANSPRLLAAFDELDVAAGDVAAALGIGPLAIDGKLRFGRDYNEYEVDAIQNLLGLITAPARRSAATAELAAARARAAAAALRIAARVEIAFHDLLAAEQDAVLRQTAFEAAETAAVLRERMRAAGNTSELALARDREAREQTRLELDRAQVTVSARREAVNALLGLSGSRTQWTATGELPEVPAEPPALDGLEDSAIAASLELSAGRERRTAAERRASAERIRAVLPEIGVGVSIADDGHQREIGPALRIGIPLFDQRSGERARANALVRREDHELAAQAIELRTAARLARATALASFREARQLQDVVVPLRQQIVGETVKHYNAMDADLFAVILARRALVEASHQAIDAARRYAHAMAEVTALQRGVMLDPAPAPGTPAPAAIEEAR